MEVLVSLTDQKLNEIEHISDAFGFGNAQTCSHIMAALAKTGISNGDFLAWMEGKILEIKLKVTESKKYKDDLRNQFRQHSRRCPECGGQVNIFPINTAKGNQVPGDYRSLWYCSEILKCGFEEYSIRTVDEEIKNFSAELAQVHKRARNAAKRRG